MSGAKRSFDSEHRRDPTGVLILAESIIEATSVVVVCTAIAFSGGSQRASPVAATMIVERPGIPNRGALSALTLAPERAGSWPGALPTGFPEEPLFYSAPPNPRIPRGRRFGDVPTVFVSWDGLEAPTADCPAHLAKD